MSRSLTEPVLQAIQAGVARLVFLAEFDFGSGALRAWTGVDPLTVTIDSESKTFSGVGTLVGITPVEEVLENSPRNVQFTISGIPSSLVRTVLGEQYRGRAVYLWIALLDEAGVPVDEPYQLWAGRMDTATIDDRDDSATINLNCESGLVDLRRPRVARYTHEEQQRRYPGDTGCRYVSTLSERPIYWRTAAPAGAPGYG